MLLKGKRVLFIIATENFRDEEFEESHNVLKANGAEIHIASTSTSEATGMMGMKLKPDVEIYKVHPTDYDALVYIGGTGAYVFYQDHIAQDLAQQAFLHGKIVAAIGNAPAILANAGLLEHKNATASLGEQGKVVTKGGIYTGKEIEVSGNIITAKGHNEAREFGIAILHALEGHA